MTLSPPRLLPCGDTAVAVEFGDSIAAGINARVIALDRAVRGANLPGVVECVPTYRSLLVHLDPLTADHAELFKTLHSFAQKIGTEVRTTRRWSVPVVYGRGFGEDLEALAERHGMVPEAVIALHSDAVYQVYMVGFMPGFTYLGGLDPRLVTPRRPTPRARIPGGSISIGGAQTAIGAAPSPSGWHLIGRTPVRCFHRGRSPTFLFEAGDEVVFQPISESNWERLASKAAAGASVATCEEQ